MPRIAPDTSGCWVRATWPSMSRRKWTVQRCQRQPNTLAMAVLRPVWASEMTSWTPSSPRARSDRRNARQNALGLGLADVQADHLAAARLVDAVGDHQGLVAHPAGLADPLHLGVQPQVRVGAVQRPLTEHRDLLVQAAAQPADGVLAHPVQAELLHQPVDLAGRDAVDIGLLDHRDQRLLGAPARLQETTGSSCPVRSLGMASSSSPTRVSQRRGR